VNRRSMMVILRQLSESEPPVSDAELLGRYAVHSDEDAFALLVQRHGRLVWAVCRHLGGPDADDAFIKPRSSSCCGMPEKPASPTISRLGCMGWLTAFALGPGCRRSGEVGANEPLP